MPRPWISRTPAVGKVCVEQLSRLMQAKYILLVCTMGKMYLPGVTVSLPISSSRIKSDYHPHSLLVRVRVAVLVGGLINRPRVAVVERHYGSAPLNLFTTWYPQWKRSNSLSTSSTLPIRSLDES